MATFKFLAAAARAHFVASDFWLVALHWFCGRFVVFIRVELRNAAAGAGHRPEKLFDLLRRKRVARTVGSGLRNHFA